MTRFYAESPCVHGEVREHRTGPFKAGGKTSWGTCSGVVRRELSVDYAAAKRAYEDAPVPIRSEDFVRRIVLAALGDSE